MRRTTFVGHVAVAVAIATIGCGGDGSDSELASSEPLAAGAAAAAPERQPPGAPRIVSVRLTPNRPRVGEMVVAFVETEDPEGDEVSLGYTWTLGNERIPGGESSVEVPRHARPDELLVVSVIASDGLHTTAASEARVRIENRAPEVASVRFENPDAVRGDRLHLLVDALDPDGQTLSRSIRWSVNGTPVEEAANFEYFSTAELRRGDTVVARVQVQDGDDSSSWVESEEFVLGNSDPEIVSRPGVLGDDGMFRYEIEAIDPDGDRSFRYSLLEGPERMSLDPVVGELQWKPAPSDEGVHWIELRVADRHGGEARQRFDLTIRVGDPDAVPASPDL